jgi:hypothetical protein
VLLQREIEESTRILPLGASFTYAQRSESVDIASLGSVVGSTDVEVYAGRFDATVLGCSLGKGLQCNPPDLRDASVGLVTLNLAVLAGYADGSSEVAGQRTSLHGPVLGTGTLLTMTAPPLAQWSRQGLLAPLLIAGFDYAATDFSAVEGWVHTFDVKPRAGLLVQSDTGALLSVYGGGSWHDFTEDQTINGVALRVRPTEPWAPLVGAYYRGGEGPLEDFSLTAEGEVGDRTGVVLTLRYEFDVEL